MQTEDQRYPLRFLPLGGLGEIGLNLMTLRWKDDLAIIDCGTMFPDAGMVGAELVLPDLRLLAERRDSVRGIVITHGHEDHIGAVPFVLRACPAPIYGPPFALALIEEKLREHRIRDVALIPVKPGEVFSVGALQFEGFRVTHSIPDALGYIIHTPVGQIVYTSDFKIEKDPIAGDPMDLDRLRRAGDEGLLALFSDSTNVQRPGWSDSERALRERLARIVRSWPGRIIVSQFASNVDRLRTFYELAEETGRAYCLVGRSLGQYVRAARSIGRAPFAEGADAVLEHLTRTPRERQMLILTGSQGEPRSALFRASLDSHPDLQVGPGDLVILSSRVIPGNERQVFRMVNHLTRLGARVIHERAADVHVSGHAHREELREVIRLTRPLFFVPLHGDYAFLAEHAALAREEGVAEAIVIENGQELGFEADGVARLERHHTELHYVDGPVTGSAEALQLKERSRLAWVGVVSVLLRLRRLSGGLEVEARLRSSGMPTAEGQLLLEAAAHLSAEMAGLPERTPVRELEEMVEVQVRHFFRRSILKKPIVHVFVEEVT